MLSMENQQFMVLYDEGGFWNMLQFIVFEFLVFLILGWSL